MVAGPSPQQQATSIRSVLKEKSKLVEGESWYVVSLRWWGFWGDYVGWHDETPAGSEASSPSSPPPPPIDNSALLAGAESRQGDPLPTQASLKRGLLEQSDFVLLPEPAWVLLHGWYGGGPSLQRKVICVGGQETQVELYPLQLKVCQIDLHGSTGLTRTVTASRRSRLKDFTDDLRKTMSPLPPEARLWERAAPNSGGNDHPEAGPSTSSTVGSEEARWEPLPLDEDSLEDIGIQDGAMLILEPQVPAPRSWERPTWPFFRRLRQEYRRRNFKDPREAGGPALTVGDKIDAAAGSSGVSVSRRVWYPAEVIDEDFDRVLVAFQYRKPPPKKLPDVVREKVGWFATSIELTEETLFALRKVFTYYAKQDSKDSNRIDRKALSALISCATNTICLPDDFRVSAVLRDYDQDRDGRIAVDEFLQYWQDRASGGSGSHWLAQELQHLYERAKVSFGKATEEELLLQESKEWILRQSHRLALARSHVEDYPYLHQDERDFRDFRRHDRVDLRLGRRWVAAKIADMEWEEFAVLAEWTVGATPTSSSSFFERRNEWLGVESERLAPYLSHSQAAEEVDPVRCKADKAPASGGPAASEIYGACGLNNLGNTCFMNSTLQALSNTVALRSYYHSGEFEAEISSSPLSMQGRLAKGFATLLKAMWAGSHSSYAPSKLKALIAEKRPEFGGMQQHDAQEILTFLLDGLHEDGNRAPYPRPTVEDPNIEGKMDEAIAREAWSGYLERNSSRIVEVFQFQIRSEVVFPDVDAKSLTFDPMMYLTLPVPKPPHVVQVTILTLAYPEVAPTRWSFRIAKTSTFKDLENLVSERCPPHRAGGYNESRRFAFADVNEHQLHRFFDVGQALSELRPGVNIHAFEVALDPSLASKPHNYVAVQLRRPSTSTGNSRMTFYRFASPQVLAYRPNTTLTVEVQDRISAFVGRVRRFLGNEQLEVTLTVAGVYSNAEGTPLAPKGTFKVDANKEALCLNFMDLEEPLNGKASSKPTLPEPVLHDADNGSSCSSKVQLEHCLDSFEQVEELAKEDWVYCTKSKQFERSLKKLDIWNTPEYLIIHLKRFGRERLTGPLEKIDTFVHFPVHLDLEKRIRGPRPEKGAQYMLYAVVNHSGNLGFGHYTAFARVGEGKDRRWYHFNDSTATRVNESEVFSKSAYILFYERINDAGDFIVEDKAVPASDLKDLHASGKHVDTDIPRKATSGYGGCRSGGV